MLPRHLRARLVPFSRRLSMSASSSVSSLQCLSTHQAKIAYLAAPQRDFHGCTSQQALLPFFGLQKKADDVASHAESFREALQEAKGISGSILNGGRPKTSSASPRSTKSFVERLGKPYHAIHEKLKESPEIVSITEHLSVDELVDAIRLLSTTSHIHSDFVLLQQIHADLLDHSEATKTPLPRRAHHFYLLSLCNASLLSQARSYLHKMSTSKYGVGNVPRTPDWNVYIRAMKRHAGSVFQNDDGEWTVSGYSSIKKVLVDKMGRPVALPSASPSSSSISSSSTSIPEGEEGSKVKRDLVSWNTLLSALFETLPYDVFENPLKTVSTEVEWIRREIVKDGFQPDQVTLCTLLLGYAEMENWEKAREIEELLFNSGLEDGLDGHVWNALLKYRGLREQNSTVREQVLSQTLQEMKQAGRQPDRVSLETIFSLNSARDRAIPFTLEEARQYLSGSEQTTGVLLDHRVYTLAMRSVGSFDDAWALYADSQRDGIASTSGMLKSLIEHSLASSDCSHHAKMIKTAYNDLLSSKFSTSSNGQRSSLGLYDIATYSALLRWCSRKEVADLDWAIVLLDDVRYQGLAFRNSDKVMRHSGRWERKSKKSTKTAQVAADRNSNGSQLRTMSASEIVCALMKVAHNHTQAFKAYSWMLPIDSKHIFTYSDFADIVRTYASLDFSIPSSSALSATVSSLASKPTYTYNPPSIFFAFFEDMRKCSLPPRSDVYQSILHYYSYIGLASSPSLAVVQDSIRQIHDAIKMDQYIDPDIGLMNRLMFAYSRAQNVPAAFGIWLNILVNRMPFDNVSVSIVLDMYGYSGKRKGQQGIQDLWKGLKRRGFKLNVKNLESYLEGLGRLGLHAQAEEAFWSELSSMEGMQVDRRTLEILLKATRGDGNVYHQLKRRLEEEMPDVMDRVKQVGGQFEQKTLSPSLDYFSSNEAQKAVR